VFGPAAQVRLFGSRATDSSKGGDIDLMVSCPAPIERPALLAAHLQLSLGEQHIDVVLEAPTCPPRPYTASPAKKASCYEPAAHRAGGRLCGVSGEGAL